MKQLISTVNQYRADDDCNNEHLGCVGLVNCQKGSNPQQPFITVCNSNMKTHMWKILLLIGSHPSTHIRLVCQVPTQEKGMQLKVLPCQEDLALEYNRAEPIARLPESCTFALPVLDIACQPLRVLVSVSKGSEISCSGSKAKIRLSICS